MSKVLRFLGTVSQHVASGKSLLTEEQILTRLDVCQTCSEFRGDKCNACGCCTGAETSYFNKLAYPGEACPKGHWGVLNSEENRPSDQTDH